MILDFLNVAGKPDFAIYCESGPVEEIEMLEIAYGENYKSHITNTPTFEDGLKLLQKNEVAAFIVVDMSMYSVKS